MLLREWKSSFILWQIENHTQRHVAQQSNAACTFKLTNRWRWMAGSTNKVLQSKEKIFQRYKSFGIWQYVIGESFLTLRRIFLLSLSMVIRPWTKSLTCDWNGISILWLPSWQPSHYTGWGVLILWSYTTCNNNHKQAVTCTGSLSLYYLKIAFFKAVLYKSVQTYIHLHRSRHTASHSRRKVSSLKSLLWEVKTSHYVLFFNSQFHRLQAPLLHLLVSNDQAHSTACFCLPLQQKQRLHEVPFPWHDGPSGHAQRSQAQQNNPVITEVNLCAF